jgi:hypothetical protein
LFGAVSGYLDAKSFQAHMIDLEIPFEIRDRLRCLDPRLEDRFQAWGEELIKGIDVESGWGRESTTRYGRGFPLLPSLR